MRQGDLFDAGRPDWEAVEAADLYAQVVFDLPLRTVFTYAVPEALTDRVLAGKRVSAPFGRGNRPATGYCVGVTDHAETGGKIKVLHAVLDERPLLSPKMLELTSWIADYYFCAWGQVLEAVLPRAVKQQSGTRWTAFVSPVPEEKRPQTKLTPKQSRVLDVLIEAGRPTPIKQVCQLARCGTTVVKGLVDKGWLVQTRRRVLSTMPEIAEVEAESPHALNDHQRRAFETVTTAVAADHAAVYLLHGVTGSGKTEVYLRAIGEAVKRGRQAIVLVPEISLTPQTIERFRRRFEKVAVLHSHLSDVDRHWHWQQIAQGNVQVVVGARSAVFAPCPNLGLIVIDEEHETTFKQETTPRYHAREVARKRAELERVPLILGSATPSLESWHQAQLGNYDLLPLPQRVSDLPMPKVAVVDLRYEYKQTIGVNALSPPLVEAVKATVSAGGQVILLLNRRGFSTALLCPQCGHVETCNHCEITLTFHKSVERLLCHFCDAEFPVPFNCSKCLLPNIRYSGFGTQRLEEEVRARFPDYQCARMDSDTMRSANHYEKVLTAFRKGEVDILLGTQMIAKGLDFPNVHLVGVISADTARNLPDFRAAERTFQLIAQVAGRTGRGKTPGRVLVQTFNPEDPALLAACRHDYERFVAAESPLRKEFGYPPFHSLVRVVVRSKSESIVKQAGQKIADRFREHLTERVRVLGPAPAPVSKLRDYHRMHFQIHSAEVGVLHDLLNKTLLDCPLPGDAEFQVDVDPLNLM